MKRGGSGPNYEFGKGQSFEFNKNRQLRGNNPSIMNEIPIREFNLAEASNHFKISTPAQEQSEKKLKLINQFISDMRRRFAGLQAEYEMIVNSIVSRTKVLDKPDSSINISEDVIIKIQMKKLDEKTREWNDLNAEFDEWMKRNDPDDKYVTLTIRDHFSKIKRELDEKINPLSERKRKANSNIVLPRQGIKYRAIEIPKTLLEKIQVPDDEHFKAYVEEFIHSITTNHALKPGKIVSMVELIVAILKRINARTGQDKNIPEPRFVNDLNDKKRAEIKGYLDTYNKGAKTDETTFDILTQILLAILEDTVETNELEDLVNSQGTGA
jgi:hypothetical protein